MSDLLPRMAAGDAMQLLMKTQTMCLAATHGCWGMHQDAPAMGGPSIESAATRLLEQAPACNQ